LHRNEKRKERRKLWWTSPTAASHFELGKNGTEVAARLRTAVLLSGVAKPLSLVCTNQRDRASTISADAAIRFPAALGARRARGPDR
jgi:hypothetical protein